ncbi:MAG: DUF3987 domain-containing protein [Puniceicoccales bacterium]|jgi:hypothetical protein|nr:DUF3987 domain-containing protein [Puniceicoccales bacterium]
MNKHEEVRSGENGKENFSGVCGNFCQSVGPKELALLEGGEPPLDAFPEEIRVWTRYYLAEFGAPEIATGMAMVTALSGAVGQLFQVTGSCFPMPTPLNLWTCLVAESGSGKSSLFKDILSGFFAASNEIFQDQENAAIALEVAEGILSKELEREGENSQLDARRKLHKLRSLRHLVPFIQDITAESLLAELEKAADNFAFLVTAESRNVFDNILGRYAKNGTLPGSVYNSLYSGDTLCANRISRGRVSVAEGRLAMLLAVQPGKAKEILENKDAIDSGLIARMFFIDAGPWERPVGETSPRPASGAFQKRVVELMARRREIFSHNPMEVRGKSPVQSFLAEPIPCSTEAVRNFAAFRCDAQKITIQVRRLAPEYCGDCARLAEAAIKIAGNFAILLKRKIIDAELSGRAIELTRFLKTKFLMQVLQRPKMKIDERFDRLVYLIERAPGGELSARELQHLHHFKKEEIEKLLAECPNEVVAEIRKSRTGRPSKILKLRQ